MFFLYSSELQSQGIKMRKLGGLSWEWSSALGLVYKEPLDPGEPLPFYMDAIPSTILGKPRYCFFNRDWPCGTLIEVSDSQLSTPNYLCGKIYVYPDVSIYLLFMQFFSCHLCKYLGCFIIYMFPATWRIKHHTFQVILGRSTNDFDVDVDLVKEGGTNRISRRQVEIISHAFLWRT